MRKLVPGEVECIYVDSCTHRGHPSCLKCVNNIVAFKQNKKKKTKKNYYVPFF